MAVETTTVRRVVPSAYPTITWSGVFAGGAVAIALDALFTVLGGAIGATAFNPYALGNGALRELTIGEGIWLLASNLVAFLIGGFVGARTSIFAGRAYGMLQGLTVWAVALVVSVFLANAALSSGLGGAVEVTTTGASPTATQAAANATAGMTPMETVQLAKSTAEAVAWWTFAAIALGAIGGIVGGRLGAEYLARRELATAPEATEVY